MAIKNLARAWVSALMLTTAFGALALETTRYVLLTGDGKRAGEQLVERSDGGLTTVRYVFKNNGRGPELSERIQVAADGTLTGYEVKGVPTFGAPVDEHYLRKAGKAEWHSTSERGAANVAGSAHYVPLNGSFEMASMTHRRSGCHTDGKLPLLPSGSLTQRRLDEVELVTGDQRRRVQLLAQTGLGLIPSADAAPEGGRSVAAQGSGRQDPSTASRAHGGAQRAHLRQRDGAPRRRLGHLGPAGPHHRDIARRHTGSPCRRRDRRGGPVVLPGLFDMHGHVDRWDGGLHLAAGVTTLRDMGSDNAQLQQVLDETASGDLLSPQIVPCGLLEGDSPHALRLGFVIKTLQQAKDVVDWYALRGYPQLKIYNSFPREMVREVVAHAHSRGMRVSGHVPVFMRAQDVVEHGFDEVQHINQVVLNFLVTPSTDTRTLDRFYLPAEKVAALDFDSKQVQDFIALLKQHNTVIDPTLAVFNFIQQRDGELSQPYAAIATHLPPDVQRNLRVGSVKIPDDATALRYKASYAKLVDFVGRLHRAGIPIVASTDGFAGFTLHSELELYVGAGLTPAQVLQIATRSWPGPSTANVS